MHPRVVPTAFSGKDKKGDFSWMIKQPEYSDSLFIFNDNVEAFQEKYKGKGGGNAEIRPYAYTNPVRAIGIPTGYVSTRTSKHYNGFKSLDSEAKRIIDESFKKAIGVIRERKPKRIFYSAKKDGSLGFGIFSIDPKVISYITQKIKDLEKIEYSDSAEEYKESEKESEKESILDKIRSVSLSS